MSYLYTCNICGDKFTGESKKGVVIAAKQHYTNQHGIQYDAGQREANMQYSEEDIREEIDEEK